MATRQEHHDMIASVASSLQSRAELLDKRFKETEEHLTQIPDNPVYAPVARDWQTQLETLRAVRDQFTVVAGYIVEHFTTAYELYAQASIIEHGYTMAGAEHMASAWIEVKSLTLQELRAQDDRDDKAHTVSHASA